MSSSGAPQAGENRGEIKLGLRMCSERSRQQHGLLESQAPKRRDLSVSNEQESQRCGYRKRSMLQSRRNPGEGGI